LKSAPVAVDGTDAGEAVDKWWESEHGGDRRPLRRDEPPLALGRVAGAGDPGCTLARLNERPQRIEEREARARDLIDV
jgi:hypothetical protein